MLGDVDYRALRRRLRDVERTIGREIDLLAYTREELVGLARRGNSLARSILDGPVTPLIGSADDLPRAG